jgi:multidrug efflux system membrane fusion protein
MDTKVAPEKPPFPDARPAARDTRPKAPLGKTARRSPVAVILGLLIIGLLAYGAYRILGPQKPAPKSNARAGAGQAQPVGVATVSRGDIKVTLDALGTVTPLANVTVKTQINGQLTDVAFREGQLVKKGDFLAQVDPRPYQVLKEQAEGQLLRDQGSLAQARADLVRYQTLMKQDSIAKQQAENQIYVVQQAEGTVKNDQGLVDAQDLNLAYCHIIAPVAGRVGLRQVDPGNYVQTSDTNGIVVLTQLEPISVLFSVPEDNLPEITREMKAGQTLQAIAYDRSNVKQLATGQVTTTDNVIDTTTGTLKIRAQFDNKDSALFPNQFVNVRLLVRTDTNVLRVPTAAVQTGAPGTYVYVVNPDDTVSVRTIKLGPTDAGNVEVTSGLNEGDKVVIDGSDRLRDGSHVSVVAPTQAGGAGTPAAAPGSPPAAGAAPSGEHRRRRQSGDQPNAPQQ